MKETVTLDNLQKILDTSFSISQQTIPTVFNELAHGVTEDYEEKLRIIFSFIKKYWLSRRRSTIIENSIEDIMKLNLTDDQWRIVHKCVFDVPALITYIPQMLKLPIMDKEKYEGDPYDQLNYFRKEAQKYINGEKELDFNSPITFTVKL